MSNKGNKLCISNLRVIEKYGSMKKDFKKVNFTEGKILNKQSIKEGFSA